MRPFIPVPFPDLLRRMRCEAELQQSIFDLPVRKWFIPDTETDFGAWHFNRPASTPVGPAAGPHTQLAQNIVLAWLAGARIIELKTVQVDDDLTIPRPCIHVPNVGYNVEWSQELSVDQSLLEYAKAVYLIEILKSTQGFGLFRGSHGFDTVYDISVGYDLDGIQSAKVSGFIRRMQHATPVFDWLRGQLAGDLARFRDIPLPESISDCVTLSTFHGCPADQIEAICRYLIDDLGLHTIVKLNPTLLGYDEVHRVLVEQLGYRHLVLEREAFDRDLQYSEGLDILRRLRPVSERQGSSIGAKFTNTLVVANNPQYFPAQTDRYMYLSGQPLHVLSMLLMQRFREALGFELPVSFSAGIDSRNFADAVACGMVPVTTCTDLLRQGGYGRLPGYLRALRRRMTQLGVDSREAYVLAAHGHGAQAVETVLRAVSHGSHVWQRHGERLREVANQDPNRLPETLRATGKSAGLDPDATLLEVTRVAGRLNGRDIVASLAHDPRYQAAHNSKEPRRIRSSLALYDCINCDLCISACPNDAIFPYNAKPISCNTHRLTTTTSTNGDKARGSGFTIRHEHQLAVLAAACNECSNCDVYCPEEGAPFRLKERVFLNREDFEGSEREDGFLRDGDTLHVRLDGRRLQFTPGSGGNRATLHGDGIGLEVTWDPVTVEVSELSAEWDGFDTSHLWRMRTVWESIYNGATPNMVNPEPARE